jgi:nitrile hydratase
MHAVGPIVAPASEPVFHEEWEGRLFGMALSMLVGGHYNLNEARHATERMEPGRYFSSSYFEQWLYFFELLMIEKGVLTEAEIAAREIEILAGRT